MNKSLISNLLAAAIVLVGLMLPEPYRAYVLNAGLFAVSGGITNWLAVHMLFERVPGLYGSGVVQIRFEDFKLGIRNLIMDQFFDNADLEAFFHGEGDTAKQLGKQLEQAIDGLDMDAAFESLLDVIMASSFAGMLGMLGGRDALKPLQLPFVEKMRDYFKSYLENDEFRGQIEQALKSALDEKSIRSKLEGLIDQRLDKMTPAMVKQIIQRMIHKHLGWLVVWGCAFGGLIGLVVTLVGRLQ